MLRVPLLWQVISVMLSAAKQHSVIQEQTDLLELGSVNLNRICRRRAVDGIHLFVAIKTYGGVQGGFGFIGDSNRAKVVLEGEQKFFRGTT